jgi:hypothetical protein
MANNQSERHDADGQPLSGVVTDTLERTGGPRRRDRQSAEEILPDEVVVAHASRSHQDAGTPARDVNDLRSRLSEDELDRLAIIKPETVLKQGSVYVDRDTLARGPFKALGGDRAEPAQRLIAKRETDFELWNRLVPSDRQTETEPAIDRPSREAHGVENQRCLGTDPHNRGRRRRGNRE